MVARCRLRERGSRVAILGVAWLNRALGTLPSPGRPDLIETRILIGDLRGRYLAQRRSQVGAGMVLGTFEGWVARAMRRYVRPGSVAYDVGASYGYHTLRMAGLVGPRGAVIAFEPDPIDRDILGRNLRANECGNTTVSPLAIGKQGGIVRFATFSYPGVSHIVRDDTPRDAVLVEAQSTTLDDFVFRDGHPAPRFVKIDVEGGELDVLLGAPRVLSEARPIVVCEVRKGELWHRVLEVMRGHGYADRVLHESPSLGDILFLPPALPPGRGS